MRRARLRVPDRGGRAAKRLMDVVVSVAVLVVTAPLQGVLWVAIRLGSPGRAIFTQERIGRRGRPFRMFKFRTMRPDAAGPRVSTASDPRVTPIGRLLRRSKLDELPQFVNVVRGDMSLVGPRPEVAEYVAQWPEEARASILAVRPGITDPASIQLRDEADELGAAADPERYYVDVLLPRKTGMYLDYVARRTLGGDVGILVRTVKCVVRPSRAPA